MKKLSAFALVLIIALSLCACSEAVEPDSDTNGTSIVTNTAAETETATEKPQGVELTLENVEEYLSFEVSREMSQYNENGADHILKVTPLVEGDYSGVNIVVEIPLYDHWYNSYTTEIDLTANLTLTKVGKATVKHPIFFDVTNLYETRGIQGDDDPTYIIKSVSGTVK